MKQLALTRADLAQALAKKLSIPIPQAYLLLEEIVEHMTKALSKNQELKLTSFGTFATVQTKQRTGRNPRTGVQAIITARRTVKFRTSGILRRKIMRTFKD
jgi:integration host factor subunit alpha